MAEHTKTAPVESIAMAAAAEALRRCERAQRAPTRALAAMEANFAMDAVTDAERASRSSEGGRLAVYAADAWASFAHAHAACLLALEREWKTNRETNFAPARRHLWAVGFGVLSAHRAANAVEAWDPTSDEAFRAGEAEARAETAMKIMRDVAYRINIGL